MKEKSKLFNLIYKEGTMKNSDIATGVKVHHCLFRHWGEGTAEAAEAGSGGCAQSGHRQNAGLVRGRRRHPTPV